MPNRPQELHMFQSSPRAIAHRSLLLRAEQARTPLRHLTKRAPRILVIEQPFLDASPSRLATRFYQKPSQFLKDFLAQPSTPSSPRKPTTSMASDEDYSNFLDKANQDTGASKASNQSTSKPSTKSVDADVPGPLQRIEQYYTSV